MTHSLLDVLALARRRHNSDTDYQNMQRAIARTTLQELTARGIELGSCRVLELAAGKGGYSPTLAEASGEFIASDLEPGPAHVKIPWVRVDAMRPFPFPNGRFDFVFCASLIEHLPDRVNLYSETRRVLADGGRALFTFPPFWSLWLVGGHQYKPFHFFGERIATRVASRRAGGRIESYEHDPGWGGLYPLTTRRVNREITAAGLAVESQWSRMTPNFMRLPGPLADLLTWQASYLVNPNRGLE